MTNRDFYYDNLTCCSLTLHWQKIPNDNIVYKLEQKEGGNNIITNLFCFEEIYNGHDNIFEVFNLKPNQLYTFKLTFKIGNEKKEFVKEVTTLISPPSILSEKSVDIANKKSFETITNNLNDYQTSIIKDCSKLIFEKKQENVLKGYFNGIEIKITHEQIKNIYYISFDIESGYFEEFFQLFIKECNNKIKIPCHFIIQNLPTILFFNLIEKGSVIFTGKRFGGVIASSLAFYILYIAKGINKIYGNTFLRQDNNSKNNIGVVTFGSPSFLTNLNAAVEMKEFTTYFYNIKEEFDFIPEIIDFLEEKNLKHEINMLLNKKELSNREINNLDNYLKEISFTKNNLEDYINKYKKIPFGFYFMMKTSNLSFVSINEFNFKDFYYFNKFNSKHQTSHLTIYNKLMLDIFFNKEPLIYLENKNYKLDLIKIIRRKNEKNIMEGIVKFKLIKFDNNIITPDTLEAIRLFTNEDKEYIINSNDIYYDSEEDITAYIDDFNENIKKATITNYFGGKISVEHIINTQGSGPSRKMLYDNLEKIFLIPFFKLFEIFYISLKNNETYNKLKKDYFGINFEELSILKPFDEQINILDELLFFTRPDILANKENEFIEEYILNDFNLQKIDIEKNSNIFNYLSSFYREAQNLQSNLNLKCLKSQNNSWAKKNKFPLELNTKEKIKKLFMCDFKINDSENNFFSLKKFDDNNIKNFFIKKLITETLIEIEKEIKKDIDNLDDNDIKKYLDDNIGKKYYDLFIVPNISFIRMIILISIEGGDLIKFNHKIDWSYLSYLYIMPGTFLMNLIWNFKIFEKDFKKNYTNDKIEEIHMKNLFYKRKMRNIINSNDSNEKDSDSSNNSLNILSNLFFLPIFQREHKIRNFSQYSEKSKNGKKYYESFLDLLNNYSNTFVEDIEISLYDNLKEENSSKEIKLKSIFDIINESIDDEESKKGFFALLRQAFLLGKLRTSIVSINII